MAAFVFLASDFFSIFLMIVTVNSNENSTSSYFNSTAWDDLNFTSGTTFVAFTESTVLSSTTRTSSGTEPPPLPAEPLPVSGRLPTPVTAGACPWTQHRFVLFFSKVPLLMLQTVLKLFTLTVFYLFLNCLFIFSKKKKLQVPGYANAFLRLWAKLLQVFTS